MKINHLHEWNLSPGAAITLQKQMADQIVYNCPIDLATLRYVGGVDVSVKDGISRAAVVVLNFPDMQVIEQSLAAIPTPFPYIPGLLSFREGPALEAAFANLQQEPDVFIFDGMGRIHPRRIGIASHLGLWLNKPTIGCGKTHLVGHYDEPAPERGSYSILTHKNEVLGMVLRTRNNVKPVYISPGHLIDLDSAIEITMACSPKYRLPEPVRAAHNAAGAF